MGAGATVRVQPNEIFNISMHLLDGSLKPTGIWGLRVDYWDEITYSYPPESSLFFYDIRENLKVPTALPGLISVKAVTFFADSWTTQPQHAVHSVFLQSC